MRQEPLVNPEILPNLVSLDIRENVGTLLDYIVAPALRRLALKFPPSSNISPDAMSFIARTGSVPTHLRVLNFFELGPMKEMVHPPPPVTRVWLRGNLDPLEVIHFFPSLRQNPMPTCHTTARLGQIYPDEIKWVSQEIGGRCNLTYRKRMR
jgi:hypothetical protein